MDIIQAAVDTIVHARTVTWEVLTTLWQTPQSFIDSMLIWYQQQTTASLSWNVIIGLSLLWFQTTLIFTVCYIFEENNWDMWVPGFALFAVFCSFLGFYLGTLYPEFGTRVWDLIIYALGYLIVGILGAVAAIAGIVPLYLGVLYYLCPESIGFRLVESIPISLEQDNYIRRLSNDWKYRAVHSFFEMENSNKKWVHKGSNTVECSGKNWRSITSELDTEDRHGQGRVAAAAVEKGLERVRSKMFAERWAFEVDFLCWKRGASFNIFGLLVEDVGEESPEERLGVVRFYLRCESMLNEERWMEKDDEGKISLEKVGPLKWTAKMRWPWLSSKWKEIEVGTGRFDRDDISAFERAEKWNGMAADKWSGNNVDLDRRTRRVRFS